MPILMTKEEWDRLKRASQRGGDSEAQRRREYIKYLNETSANMTKNWPNSLENVNKRNEELRRKRLEIAENANTEFYKKHILRKKMEQEHMMYSARDTVFKNKDAPKMLISGVVESVIQKEREEQRKFNADFMGKYENEQKTLWDERIKKNAEEFHANLKEMKKKRFEINKKHQQDLLDQAKEINERNRREYEEELEMQRQDIINSNIEMEKIKTFDTLLKIKTKENIINSNEKASKERKALIEEKNARDNMDDRLIEVLNKSKQRVEKRRKETEKLLKDEKLRILDANCARLTSGDSARDAKEQASLQKALDEREALVKAKAKEQSEKIERIRKERLDAHDQFLKEEAQRIQDEHTMQQWALLNRFKNQELFEVYKKQQVAAKKRQIEDYRTALLEQIKENKDREAREIAERRYFYGELAEKKMREADNKLFHYAEKLIEEAEKNGRPTLPIKKVIERYCRINRLHPMPPLPASLQEHFSGYAPRDLTRRDPRYEEPAPPPHPAAPRPAPTPAPPAPSAPPAPPAVQHITPDAKRDGLQDVPKAEAGPSVPKEEKKKEGKDDYKRTGRADGLQRRDNTEAEAGPSVPKEEKKKEGKDDYKRTGRADGLQRRDNTEGDIILLMSSVNVTSCECQECHE